MNMQNNIILPFYIFVSISISGAFATQRHLHGQEHIPQTTRWLLDAATESEHAIITSVYMLRSKKKPIRGTGFLLKDGPIITAEHVILENEAADILAISSYGEKISIKKIIRDPMKRDLALLIPDKKLEGGLELSSEKTLSVGVRVSTWGFPEGWDGLPPLLSVGYLSGFLAKQSMGTGGPVVKLLVVNGAFNPGNSGGPLFLQGDNKVIGLVVSKLIPIDAPVLSAIEALKKKKSGIVFDATDEEGKKVSLTESQVVAIVLERFKQLTQVMIGQAIDISEIRAFLEEQEIK